MTALVRESFLFREIRYADILLGVVQLDPWLAPYKESLRKRYTKAQDWITALNKSEGGLEKFSRVGDIALPCFQSLLKSSRARRSSASTLIKETTSPTENGRPMLRMHSSSATSVVLACHTLS